MSANEKPEAEAYALPLSRTLRLLLAEDSPADAELIRAVLKRAGYPLIFNTVSTPADFEERLRTEDYDIVLSDHNLLSWTGMDALEILHRTRQDIPFVVVTATLGDEAAVEYIKRGAADYVLKHRLEKLPIVVGQALRERSHRDQQRALQDKIQCAKREWELTFDAVPEAMFLADEQCNIRRANQAARQLLGLQFSDIIGHACPELLSGLCQPIPECPQAGHFPGAEKEIARSSNGKVYEASSMPVRDATGALRGCVHVVRDVTDWSKAQEALRESERKYRELVENTPYGVFRSSPDGRFLDVNPALVTMLGYGSKEEVLALNLATNVYRRPTDRTAVLEQYREDMSHSRGDVCWMKKDGSTLLIRTSGRAVRNSAGQIQYYEVIAEDITAQRTLEAELRQAQKMEAVGRLAGGIAHDFNNLLAVIMGNTELLLEPVEPAQEQRRRLEQIRTAAGRAAELTQRLLSFSRKQTLEERVFDINEVVKDTSKLLNRVLGEDIHLVLKLNASPEPIRADQAQVEQALMNLSVNARDAMPDGGSLVIETSDIELDGTSLGAYRTVAPGTYVVLTFSDTGVGMDEPTRNRIFEPFFTTKEPGKGTGLGLAMVYGFVRQSRGLIHVDSELGKGTTFQLYFPKVRAKEEVVVMRAPAPIVGGAETILLAEDEESLRDIAAGVLQSLGYTVLSAASGPEALEIAHQSPKRIDLLLTDMVMPGMTGRELAEQLAGFRPDVKVVYMSGYAGDLILQHAPRVPVGSWLHKPFTRKDIAQKVREALDRQGSAPVVEHTDVQKVPA